MPLYLRAPRAGKSPYYEIRGAHLGVKVEESTKTGVKKLALELLRKKREDIERGAVARPGEPTFGEAAERYMTAGGDATYLYDEAKDEVKPLLLHFAETPLSQIAQAAIDDAAGRLYPNASTATRNRHVYTPVSAVLKRAGLDFKVKRPKGWQGKRRTTWLRPEQAFAVFKACDEIKAPASTQIEFRILNRLLCYTGMRLGDALKLTCDAVDLKEGTAMLPKTKNGKPRLAYLPAIAVEELGQLPNPIKGRVGRVFSFYKGSRLYGMFNEALAIAGVTMSEDVAFHVWCHTWATWMRRYGKLDTYDLVDTGRWADPDSAAGYNHVVVTSSAKQADLLPTEEAA